MPLKTVNRDDGFARPLEAGDRLLLRLPVRPQPTSRVAARGRGFQQVYEYAAGKADWGAFGLPLEGRRGSATRVGSHTRTDVPTCRLDDRLGDVCERLADSDWDTCFVVNERGVVLGRLGRSALAGGGDASVEEALTPGPKTVRPSLELDRALELMRAQDLTGLPVTHSDGILVGLIRREDVERALERDSP
jgi:CBS domain-containing protein